MSIRSIFVLCIIAISTAVYGQRTEKVVAQYSYTVSNSVLPMEAMHETIRRAQVQAIENAFGSSVSESSSMIMQTGMSDKDAEDYFSLAECDVRGFWLESTSDTIWDYRPDFKNKTMTYSVRVEGKIKEWTTAVLDVQYDFLFNGTDVEKNKLRNNSYKDGDQVYVHFKAPVDGYLAIYNVDYSADKLVQRVYPYPGFQIDTYQIQADKDYILFSPEHAPLGIGKNNVMEFCIGAITQHDFNQFYIIFSPKPFRKPSENQAERSYEGRKLQAELGFGEFQRWLAKARNRDSEMFVEKLFVDVIK